MKKTKKVAVPSRSSAMEVSNIGYTGPRAHPHTMRDVPGGYPDGGKFVLLPWWLVEGLSRRLARCVQPPAPHPQAAARELPAHRVLSHRSTNPGRPPWAR